jgi:hypothetical protein
MARTEKYQGQNVDLARLANRIETYLENNDFDVAVSKDPHGYGNWFFIQAVKLGTFRTISGTRQSTDITIRGDPNSLEVTIGTGEWGKNLIAGAPLFLAPPIGIGATIAKLYFGKKFEDNLWKYVEDQVRFLVNTATQEQGKEYSSEYVEGYPGWNTPTSGGSLILQRQGGEGKNSIIFRSPDGRQITFSAESVTEANIVTGKKGMRPDDLMLRIEYKEGENTYKPVFNVGDDVIRGVLGGINELVAEDKQLRAIAQTKVITGGVKYCSNCGFEVPKDAKFCSSCGTKQEVVAQTQIQAQA